MSNDTPSPSSMAGRKKPEPYKKPGKTDQEITAEAKRTLKRGQQLLKNKPHSQRVSIGYDHPCTPEDFDRIVAKMHAIGIEYRMNIFYVMGRAIWVGRAPTWPEQWARS